MSILFEKTREFVEKNFKNEAQMLHFDRTVYWLKILKPNADEAFLIAAIGHDIQRAFAGSLFVGKDKKFTDVNHIKEHQETGARILGDFLKEQDADTGLIKRVKHLVSKHEVGGDDDQNLLKDADCLSFLENNADIFLNSFNELGYNKVKEKFDWMYQKITSLKAKEIAKSFYEKIIRELNAKKKTDS